jgi:hypothetical protein
MGAKAGAYALMDTSAMCYTSHHTGLIRAVGITAANAPEASITREISADLERQSVVLKELPIAPLVLEQPFCA